LLKDFPCLAFAVSKFWDVGGTSDASRVPPTSTSTSTTDATEGNNPMRKTVFRRSVFAGTTILALSLALAACGSEETPGGSTAEETAASQTEESPTEESPTDDETTDDEMTAEARSGAFEGLNDKSVEGSVEVSATEIVLSEFSSDEGPDLHVYLTNGSEAADVAAGVLIDVVAFDEASQTFTLDGVDVAGYDTVVINCDKAKAVFGAAPLA
jgi:hypothetical protein